MNSAVKPFLAFLLVLVCASNVFSGSGGGFSQRSIPSPDGGQSAPASPAQNATAALLQNPAPAGAGGIMLDAIPLGAITGGGGHYNPPPVVTNGGGRTFLVVPNGSRVRGYVDGIAGLLVNGIPITQTLAHAEWGGCTNGSPQFSADQKRVAYIVDLDNNKHAVVIDGTMSPKYDYIGWLSFAPVGHHFAYQVGRANGAGGSGSFVVDDGKAGKMYNGIGPAFFSPDGNHLAYVATAPSKGLTPIERQEGKTDPQNTCVVLDGVEQKYFSKIEQPLVFSQDGKHLGYFAGTDYLKGGNRAVIDGHEGTAYTGVQQLVFSDDGTHSAYVATKTFPKKVTQNGITSDASYQYDVVVENGKEDPADDSVPSKIQILRMSHDGKRIAYVHAIDPSGPSGHVVIVDNCVDDGKPSQQYPSCLNLQISPDGKTVLYIVGGVIVVNGKEYGPFSGTFSPAFSQEGGHWACGVSLAAGGFAIIEDGKTIAVKGVAPETLAFQPGTNKLMMKAPNSHDGIAIMFEVKGDVESAADVPTDTVYSPNHQHVAKVFTSDLQTSEQKQKIVIDDQPPTPANYTSISKIAISDDGRHVAVIDGTHVVYDGTQGPGYFRIHDLALSPDGQHVAYVAEKANPGGIDTYVVIDGMEGPAFLDVLMDGASPVQGIGAYDQYRQLRFASDGSLHFLPVINGQLYRCSYPAEAFKGLPSLATHEAEKPGPRDLHDFKRPQIFQDQAEAMGFILAPDETIYGVSDADGKFKHGTLFKLKTDGSGFSVLHDFYGGDDDGQNPTSLLLLPDGSIFGIAEKPFRYDLKAQQFALVTVDPKDHLNMLAGATPDGTVIGFGGGSIMDKANVVSMSADGSNYVSFANGQNAKPPLQYSQVVAGKDGTFFAIGMVQNKASIVKFKSLKDSPTLVHKFAALPTDGNRPEANLTMDSKGNLYGSTSAGGMSQKGVIYKVSADGSNYQVVYNPDEFAFSNAFVAGDDGMLYGISKEGVAQLAPDGSGKPPKTVVAFDGANFNFTNNRGMTNILFHDDAVYGMHGAAIYKVTLPKAGTVTGTGAATPTVAIKTIQPQPLAAEAITITDPTGAASAGTAAPSIPVTATPVSPTAAQQPPPQAQPASPSPSNAPPPQQSSADAKAAKKAKKAQDGLDKLKGLIGH